MCLRALMIRHSRLEFSPEPERGEHEERAQKGGDHVTQRDGDLVQARPNSEHPKEESADESTDEAKREVAKQAEAATLPGRQCAREPPADEPNNDPDDEMVKRKHDWILPAFLMTARDGPAWRATRTCRFTSFSHVGGRNARFMKAILVHCIRLANENVRCHLVFGAPEFAERCKQSQIIESLQRQRETQCSRF